MMSPANVRIAKMNDLLRTTFLTGKVVITEGIAALPDAMRSEVMERVQRFRGRIDILQTFSEDLLAKGMVACRFEEFTFDTPRNRLVRAALNALTSRLADATLRHHCARLAADFGRQGVSGVKPTRAELSGTRMGRHDHDDLLMVSLAKLVFDLVIPTEDAGSAAMTRVEKNQVLVRRLFEKAVGNFYRSLLTPRGWTVQQGKHLPWQIDFLTPDAEAFFPSMISDIILENRSANARIIIDTKFTSVLTRSQHKEAVLKSGYVYQLYSYLRSQERTHDPLSLTSKGMFLHPVVGSALDESVRIQGHEIRFVTVDLTESTSAILAHLQRLIICPEDC